MGLHLEDVRGDAGDGTNGFDVDAFVVRQADCARLPRRVGLFEGRPRQCYVAPVEGGKGPVDEQEIDVVGA